MLALSQSIHHKFDLSDTNTLIHLLLGHIARLTLTNKHLEVRRWKLQHSKLFSYINGNRNGISISISFGILLHQIRKKNEFLLIH
jgi:hypothetical protein